MTFWLGLNRVKSGQGGQLHKRHFQVWGRAEHAGLIIWVIKFGVGSGCTGGCTECGADVWKVWQEGRGQLTMGFIKSPDGACHFI